MQRHNLSFKAIAVLCLVYYNKSSNISIDAAFNGEVC